jgi:hypothetical protein
MIAGKTSGVMVISATETPAKATVAATFANFFTHSLLRRQRQKRLIRVI